ncbi:hypothetical protein, conserved [Babesia bigemina]|uniref:Uncharacterized protein n=1 Tax=Babesia bigemina TaxID=5866 RepID=A0A061BJR3_BABBI|nr:hypothetical protein, conserved [Babesia bigemina]CDR71707.1 hypothetical protein, conserved [Babesia bigemina]|eukprot:XP_012770653.1 hypothetical protein, conserved [Babesia bigemina]
MVRCLVSTLVSILVTTLVMALVSILIPHPVKRPDAEVDHGADDDDDEGDGDDDVRGGVMVTSLLICQLGDLWNKDYDVCANKSLRLAVERDAERYLAYEEIADVAAHREAEDAQVEQDDGDDDGNDDGGDGLGGRGGSSHLTAHLGDLWNKDYDVCANKSLRLAVERDAERYLAYEEIADVAAHREAEDAQVEQDDGDDDGNDDGGDGLGRRGG